MEEDIKTILIDVDDCLLPTDGRVSFSFFYGLEVFFFECMKKSKNGEFPQIGWCSGRDRNYIEAVSFVFGLPNSWSIIESGIALFNPTTKELILNPELTLEVKEVFAEISQKRIPRILQNCPDLYLYPGNMIQVTLERQYGSDLLIEEAYETARNELSDLISLGLVTVHHSQIAVDISPAGIDKASGVRFLTEKTGVPLEKTLGIGDSRGDFPMLEIVGHVGCPANASEECKKLINRKGGHIAIHDYVRGVVSVIRYFTQRERYFS